MNNFWRLLGYLKPYRWRVIAAVLLMGLITISAVPMPLLFQYVIDDVFPNKKWSALTWVFWAVIGIHVLRGVVSFTLNYLINWLGQRVVFDLRFQSYRHLNRLSLSYYDQRQTGKIMARLTGDIDVIQYMITGGFVTLITDIVTLVAVTGVIFWKEWRLALITLAVVPLYVLVYKLYLKYIRDLSVQLREKWDAMLGTLQEKIAGISVVKAFVREDYETERFMQTVKENFALGMKQVHLNRQLGLFAGLVRAVGTAAVWYYGSVLVLGRQLQAGELLAFTFYMGYLYDPAVRVVDFNITLQWAGAAIDRVFEVLDTRPDIEDSPNARPLPQMRGEIEFRNVSFGYRPGQLVLKNVNLHIRPGEVVALVGPSGAGKSTLVNLIARFYDVTDGQVLIDGVDVRDIKLESIRRNVGMVMQESLLFSVTIKENIAYGRHNATEEEIVRAAKQADLHDFILTLPDAYDTKIGEDGIKLSVGQKQRLSIARAILTDPKILILDDATSALDSQTEANVQQALEHVMQGRTSIVIAHRLSTVVNADKIVVLDKGEVVDIGTHEELVNKPGVYRTLYEEQFKSAADLLLVE
ncbi:MAG: ABC transporter ATP-binding protein/permease [Firmicutes bacterium]|nr:ABC transporter ATP-binding protein/permease [Bacillota bacterium]